MFLHTRYNNFDFFYYMSFDTVYSMLCFVYARCYDNILAISKQKIEMMDNFSHTVPALLPIGWFLSSINK